MTASNGDSNEFYKIFAEIFGTKWPRRIGIFLPTAVASSVALYMYSTSEERVDESYAYWLLQIGFQNLSWLFQSPFQAFGIYGLYKMFSVSVHSYLNQFYTEAVTQWINFKGQHFSSPQEWRDLATTYAKQERFLEMRLCLLHKGAKSPETSYMLGEMYHLGIGVGKDLFEAQFHYIDAMSDTNLKEKATLQLLKMRHPEVETALDWIHLGDEINNSANENSFFQKDSFDAYVAYLYSFFLDKHHERSAYVYYRLGRYFENGWDVAKDFQKALVCFYEGLLLNGDEVRKHLEDKIRQRDFDSEECLQATKCLLEFDYLIDSTASGWLELANSLYDQAKKTHSKDTYFKSLVAYSHVITLNPDHSEVYTRLSKFFIEGLAGEKNYNRAIFCFQKILSLEVDRRQHDAAIIGLQEIEYYEDATDHERVHASLAWLIHSYPNLKEAHQWSSRGDKFLQSSKTSKSDRTSDRYHTLAYACQVYALQLDPDCSAAHLGLGECIEYGKMGENYYQVALQLYQKAAKSGNRRAQKKWQSLQRLSRGFFLVSAATKVSIGLFTPIILVGSPAIASGISDLYYSFAGELKDLTIENNVKQTVAVSVSSWIGIGFTKFLGGGASYLRKLLVAGGSGVASSKASSVTSAMLNNRDLSENMPSLSAGFMSGILNSVIGGLSSSFQESLMSSLVDGVDDSIFRAVGEVTMSGAFGAGGGVITTATMNIMRGKPLDEDLKKSALLGGISGLVYGGVGVWRKHVEAKRLAEEAEKEFEKFLEEIDETESEYNGENSVEISEDEDSSSSTYTVHGSIGEEIKEDFILAFRDYKLFLKARIEYQSSRIDDAIAQGYCYAYGKGHPNEGQLVSVEDKETIVKEIQAGNEVKLVKYEGSKEVGSIKLSLGGTIYKPDSPKQVQRIYHHDEAKRIEFEEARQKIIGELKAVGYSEEEAVAYEKRLSKQVIQPLGYIHAQNQYIQRFFGALTEKGDHVRDCDINELKNLIKPNEAYRLEKMSYRDDAIKYVAKHLPHIEILDKAKIGGVNFYQVKNTENGQLYVVCSGTTSRHPETFATDIRAWSRDPGRLLAGVDDQLNKWCDKFGGSSVYIGHSLGGYVVTHMNHLNATIHRISFNALKAERGYRNFNLALDGELLHKQKLLGGIESRYFIIGEGGHGISEFKSYIDTCGNSWDQLLFGHPTMSPVF